MKIIRYDTLHYTALFNNKTGFMARIEDKGFPEPFWSPSGPELIDIAITNWCDRECSFCYRSSHIHGKHMNFLDYCKIIDTSKNLHVFQVALGGGNPNQHPEFISILEYTHNAGIVPNYTTNGRGLTDQILEASKKYCGAVAVSAYEPEFEMIEAINSLLAFGVKTNVHFLLDSQSIEKAITWLTEPPKFLKGINALVFLNYKPIGRAISNKLLNDSPKLGEFYSLVSNRSFPFKIGFDACSVSGLFSHTSYNSALLEACDAGRFSMFISEDMKAYPCSFQKELHNGVNIPPDGNYLGIWQKSKTFVSSREYFASDKCKECPHYAVCMNGCPVFENVTLC